MGQKNNFRNINFYGNTQISNGDIININSNIDRNSKTEIATYSPEPIWRSPITLASLTWISFFITLGSIFPLYKVIIEPIQILLGYSKQNLQDLNNQLYFWLSLFCIISFSIIFTLRGITKYQTRYPLIYNYAISGLGHKITLEKVTMSFCPQCGGEMRYYNKPIEWIDMHYSNGHTRRKVTKTAPALECKRNREHWYRVDPAEDRV
jgi:hypothetical protein